MGMSISSAAATSREQARQKDGRFGHQSHAEGTVILGDAESVFLTTLDDGVVEVSDDDWCSWGFDTAPSRGYLEVDYRHPRSSDATLVVEVNPRVTLRDFYNDNPEHAEYLEKLLRKHQGAGLGEVYSRFYDVIPEFTSEGNLRLSASESFFQGEGVEGVKAGMANVVDVERMANYINNAEEELKDVYREAVSAEVSARRSGKPVVGFGGRFGIADDRLPGDWILTDVAPDDAVGDFEKWQDRMKESYGPSNPAVSLESPLQIGKTPDDIDRIRNDESYELDRLHPDYMSLAFGFERWWVKPAPDNPAADRFKGKNIAVSNSMLVAPAVQRQV